MQRRVPARTLVFGKKLSFLSRLIREDAKGKGVGMLHSLMDEAELTSLMKECRGAGGMVWCGGSERQRGWSFFEEGEREY